MTAAIAVDTTHFDAVVIGAGPAGGSAARELSKRGRKVLLIERSPEIGQPNYSTAGTPKSTIIDFALPLSIASASWDRIFIKTAAVQAEWKYPEAMGYVLDFAELRRFLAEDAAKNGSEIMVGTAADELIEKDNAFSVRYRGASGEGVARASVIIDATGHHELANTRLHLNAQEPAHLVEGMEYLIASTPEKIEGALALFLGSAYAPNGYAWCFPMNGNKAAKVGICRYGQVAAGGLRDLQERFMSALPYFRHVRRTEPMEIHAGAAHLDGGVTCHVHKNVLLIGDAAHQVNPLAGEGIRHALRAGQLAAEAVDVWLKSGHPDPRTLKNSYEQRWKAEFAWKWRLSFLFSNLFYHQLGDAELDRCVRAFQTVTPQDTFDVFFNYAYRKLLKYSEVVAALFAFGKEVLATLTA